jgi:uncharacterized repeat protein (TIGR03803 family)
VLIEMVETKERGDDCFGKFMYSVCGCRQTATSLLAAGVLLLVASTSVSAQILTSLLSFNGTNGTAPVGRDVVQATNGNLYGTTNGGGANNLGTVFKLTSGGMLNTLYNFDGMHGSSPQTGLVQGTDGNLYGTTQFGGTNSSCDVRGCGTVFKISPSGTLTVLYSFCEQSDCVDGDEPYAGLIQATDGNFYGATDQGGAYGYGTLFKIAPSGAFTTLHSFDFGDGAYPSATLTQATDGNLYGTTGGGGSGSCNSGCGTIFKSTLSGILTTLYSFCSQSACADGSDAFASLEQATDGNFYGTTFAGGANGDGTVFRITPGGVLTTLHSFDGTDGSESESTLVQGTDGNLYGTTEFDGANSSGGTVFEITLGGVLTTVYSFCSQSNCTDGSVPTTIVQDTNGKFYGTTVYGGANGDGTVFRLSVGLGPFVETQPTSGRVGATVKILGTNLTGATSVTFNGTPAMFTGSSTSIKASVPMGATTGTVQVVTPHGTLSSNVVFRVRP